MQNVIRILWVCVFAVGLVFAAPLTSGAKPITDGGGVTLDDTKKVHGGKKPSGRHSAGKHTESDAEYKRRMAKSAAEWKAYRASLTKYEARMRAWTSCLQTTDHSTACVAPTAPKAPGDLYANGVLDPTTTLSDEDAAYIAFARLRLTPPTPIIGPSPNLNEWKMAAVGYPLWLSIGGDPTPPAVADAVADVHVRLEAHVSKVVFSMGDRHSVICTNVTTVWSESVRGKSSPVCGYRYQKPSLPERSYTVTATTYWSVAWSTSRDRGVIPFIQSSSTQLPVGELQVLVR